MFYKLKFFGKLKHLTRRIILGISYFGTWKMQHVLRPEYQTPLT
jgi:hypothetical protein